MPKRPLGVPLGFLRLGRLLRPFLRDRVLHAAGRIAVDDRSRCLQRVKEEAGRAAAEAERAKRTQKLHGSQRGRLSANSLMLKRLAWQRKDENKPFIAPPLKPNQVLARDSDRGSGPNDLTQTILKPSRR
jgi:hypothetical protein